ncbi:MAG TPA: SDR family NAD(P)-dependent oxidoreductase [Candidatus Binatia bacterium]|nr:SDR family NAD(P)-dependent oxidoreductase [Candidatus Binatia bacterium]
MATPSHPLAGKVVIVTGAVGNLGLATARELQKVGAKTVLVDRSNERLKENYPDLVNSTDHFLAGGVDLAEPDSLAKTVQTALARFRRIDSLVNTVGAWRGGKPAHETDLADWDFLFGANVRTTLLCCRAVIPQMLGQGRGSIVNVASRDGLQGSAGYSAYSASKSAVLRLTESMADELKNSNINVNCIMPATIDTPQNRKAMPNADFSKWIAPEAIAEVILFLISDAARAINGAAVPVFGKAITAG